MKKVNLAEAKKLLDTETVFLNGDRFTIPAFGKYQPNLSYEVPSKWEQNSHGKPFSPVQFREWKEYTRGMNIDFDGDVTVLFGAFRTSQSGKPVFKVLSPECAPHVLVQIDWGGCFNHSRGMGYGTDIDGALYYRHASSNGGGAGYDFIVLPVGYVDKNEPRDVSEMLKAFSDSIKSKQEEMNQNYAQLLAAQKASADAKNEILAEIEPVITEIQQYEPEYRVRDDRDEKAEIVHGRHRTSMYYGSELVDNVKADLDSYRELQNDKDEWLPKFETVLKSVRLIPEVYKFSLTVSIPYGTSNDRKCYSIDERDYAKMLEDISKYQERKKKEAEEQAILEEKIAWEGRLNDAVDAGYPVYRHWHRVGGATGLAYPAVIDTDGSLRDPDSNELRNPNHRYKYSNWLVDADGNQSWQLLPGEIVVLWTKDCRADNFHLSVEFSDGELTEDQVDAVLAWFPDAESAGVACVDADGVIIDDAETWLTDAVSLKN